MAAKKEELVPIRTFAGIFKFGKEKSKIKIDKTTLIAIAIILSLLVILAHILFKYLVI